MVSENDYRGMSYNNKNNLIYLIMKFLRNNDGEVPNKTLLYKLKTNQLFYIWKQNMPKDIWRQFV